MGYEIQLNDRAETVEEADAYAQEGVLTTFFRTRDGRTVLDSWAQRVASYRTADITRIRWLAAAESRGDWSSARAM